MHTARCDYLELFKAKMFYNILYLLNESNDTMMFFDLLDLGFEYAVTL